ncbi:MAG: PilT/PilU family type 4a pilus ATPase [Myxococcales bacterium]|nr:PilT/PilU family type 4a pilus ATPase [Myxococcales bacterium]
MSAASTKTPSLLGRLAVKLEMITMEQLRDATAAQGRHPEKRLGEILLELGHLDRAALDKLEKVQRDVVAKHRAKRAAGASPLADAEKVEAAPAPTAADRARKAALPPSDADAGAPNPSRKAPTAAPPTPSAAPAEAESGDASELDFAIGDDVPYVAIGDDAGPAPELELASGPGHASAPEPAPAAASVAATDPPPIRPSPAEAVAAARPPVAAEGAEVAGGEHGDSLDLALSFGSGERERLATLLGDAVAGGASDVHVHAGAPLKLRVNGALADTGAEPLSADAATQLVLAALTPAEQRELARAGEIDSCLSLPGVGRFRMNAYRQQRGFDAVFRAIPAKPPTLESLGLPNALAKFTNYHQGMVLVTGPAGCGKSSTMAALVNLINEERDEHILTVEDPIEYLHAPKRCLVNQRHAGRHTGSFARALRAALREDPDVIVIGELRDLETISLAMTAAETGHFVLATLHTANAVRTINRMIGAFPSNRQDQVRTMLSESLRAVISQRLVPTVDGSRRVPALELLVINKAIANLIRDEKTVQIRSSIQTGSSHGMCLLEQSLNELVRAGTIDKETALYIAEDKKLITA